MARADIVDPSEFTTVESKTERRKKREQEERERLATVRHGVALPGPVRFVLCVIYVLCHLPLFVFSAHSRNLRLQRRRPDRSVKRQQRNARRKSESWKWPSKRWQQRGQRMRQF